MYARCEEWVERKRARELAKREELLRQDLRECTFYPSTASRGTPMPVSVTDDRARDLFERQLSWKQRLDDSHEQQRRLKREAAEQEVRAIRQMSTRSAHATTPRGDASHQAEGGDIKDPDATFDRFYERNCAWQRAREENIERRSGELLTRALRPWEQEARVYRRPRSASVMPRSVGGPPPARSSSSGSIAVADAGRALSFVIPEPLKLQTRDQKCLVGGAGVAPPRIAMAPVHAVVGQPIRARRIAVVGCPPGVSASSPASGERAEVLSHLQALRSRLVSAQGGDPVGRPRVVGTEAVSESLDGADTARAAPPVEYQTPSKEPVVRHVLTGHCHTHSTSTACCLGMLGIDPDKAGPGDVPTTAPPRAPRGAPRGGSFEAPLMHGSGIALESGVTPRTPHYQHRDQPHRWLIDLTL